MRSPDNRGRSRDRGERAARGARSTASRSRGGVAAAPLLTRSRRRMILVVLVVGLVGTCLTALLTSPLVAVRHVVVKGLASLAPDEVAEIRAQTVLEPNAHLFRVPTAKVAGALRQLPFIARVSVTRRFPDRLDVTVVPRQPVAILSTQ